MVKKFSFIIFLLYPGLSLADTTSRGMFDDILNRFAQNATNWEHIMLDYAAWLFWGLVLISMVWTYGMMALRRADIQEFLAETMRFFAVTGFFFWALENGPAIVISIMDSTREIASKASGLPNNLSPSGIVDVGFDIMSKVVDNSSVWSPANSTVGLICAGIILVVLALIGINMLLLLISAWLLAYGGVFLLGFGGSRWSQDIAIQYYKTVIGIAMQIFTMVLIIGIGRSFIDQYYISMSGDMALKELFVMLVVSIILLYLVDKIPPLIGGIVGGSQFGASQMGGFGFGAAVGAAGMAAAGVNSGGAGLLGAANSTAGGAQALTAAVKAAQNGMQSSSNNSVMSAFANASRFAADIGVNLAKGAASVSKAKFDDATSNTKSNIDNTVGGKMANAIKNSQNNSLSGEE